MGKKKSKKNLKQTSIMDFVSNEQTSKSPSKTKKKTSPRKTNSPESNNNNNNNNNKQAAARKKEKKNLKTEQQVVEDSNIVEEVVDQPTEVISVAEVAPEVIPEESDDEDLVGVFVSNGIVDLSPTTATFGSPSEAIESPDAERSRIVRSDSSTTPTKSPQPFQCKKCDQLFRNRYFMRKHMLMDHEHQLYKCRICSFTSVFPEKLKIHIIKQHVCKKERNEAISIQTLRNENEVFEQQAPRKIIMIDGVPLGKVKKVPQCYICDVCGKVYSSKFSLERHVRCHTGERPYSCDVCDFTTSYREHMQRHMTSVHLVVHSDEPKLKYIPKHKRTKEDMDKENSDHGENEEVEGETESTAEGGSPSKKRRNIARKRFECAACGLKATHKSDLVEHIKEKHPKAHIVSLDNNDGSKVHLVVTASKKPRVTHKFSATCSYCSKVFNDNWKYMVHLRSHTGVKPFSCSECDFHATTKMTVRDHIHRKHPDNSDAKLILKLVNITDGSVEEVAIDVPTKEFKCEYCHEVFPGNYELKGHRFKDHPEAKPFSCSMCDQKEWGKSSIIIHCSERHPEFELETLVLKNNKLCKLGVINLPKCDTCSKMFPYQSLLYLHQRTHTGERNYGCDSCDFRTDSKKALTRHILKKHLDTNLNKEKPKKKKKKVEKVDASASTEDDIEGGVEMEARNEEVNDDDDNNQRQVITYEREMNFDEV